MMDQKTYQKRIVSYNRRIESLKSCITSSIDSIMEGHERVEVDDLYLGEYQPILSGYPTIEAIENRNGDIIVINDEPGKEERGLDDYNVEELLAILLHIKTALDEA